MKPGDRVGGAYELLERAAEGGSSAIFRAVDRRSGAEVACKLSLLSSPEASLRFTREAALLQAIEHPGVVRCLAHGVEGGLPFLIQPWLGRLSLQKILDEGPLAPEAALPLLYQAAEALGALHALGHLHGDLSPANLMITGAHRDRVVLIDLGVARPFFSPDAPPGTPGYLAPEQAAGGTADARSDVFALGCLIFRAIAGRNPFPGATAAALLAQVLTEQAPRLSSLHQGLDPALDALLADLLARDPALRPPDARSVALALRPFLSPVLHPLPRRLTARERRSRAALLSLLPAPSLPPLARAAGASPLLLPSSRSLWLFDEDSAAFERAARLALSLHRQGLRGLLLFSLHTDAPPSSLDPSDLLRLDASSPAALAPDAPGPLLDEAAAALLAARFSLLAHPAGWWLLGERSGPGSLLGRPAPFVGRTLELACLSSSAQRVLSSRSPLALLVLGDTGAGKTRFAREGIARVGVDFDTYVARGDPLTAGSPFGLLRQILAQVGAFSDGLPLAERFARLEQRVLDAVGEGEGHRVAGFLGALLGLPVPDSVQLLAAREDPVLMGDQLLRAFLDWIAAEARRRPVLLVLDDLHWGDLPSLRFLDAALGLAGTPLLVLGLADAELDLNFPRLWAERRPQRLHLPPLSPDEAITLARSVLQAPADEDELKSLVEQAEGHPFFLEELLRTRARGAPQEAPLSALAVLEQRLSGLSAGARRALRAASCFGRVFWEDGVRELLGSDPRAALDELLEEELVVRRPRSRLAGEQEYGFRQALVRSAAYAMLTGEDVLRGHALAARWLERRGERDAAVLAEHFERGGEHQAAARCFRAAAAQALEGNDLVGAVAQAERGLRSGPDARLGGELRLLQAEALGWQGELDHAANCAEEALERLEPGTAGWYQAAGLLASLSARSARFHRLNELNLLLLASPLAPGCELRPVALAQMAIHQRFAGHIRAAEALVARLGEPDRPGRPGVLAWTLRARSHLAAAQGHPALALRFSEEAARHHRAAGDLRNAAIQLVHAGSLRCELGCFPQATAMLEEASRMAEQLRLRLVHAAARLARGKVLLARGVLEEAEPLVRSALDDLDAMAHRRLALNARATLARVALLRGDPRSAARIQPSVERPDETPGALALAWTVLSSARLALGDPLAALVASRNAWALRQRLGHLEEGEISLLRAHAEALLAVGLHPQAQHLLTQARSWILCNAASCEPDLRRCLLVRSPDGKPLLRLAHRILDECF